MITITDLSYTYPGGARPALDRLSLQIQSGEFVLLAGKSGSGKSTLLRALCGLVPHFSGGTIAGSIEVDGRRPIVDGPGDLGYAVGFVFQNPESQAVVDHVESEVAFGLENAAVPPSEMRVRVEEVLQLLELAPLRDRSLKTLSGGERQRVAIAAALALRPRVLALDEPTSQLDPQSAADVLAALVRLNEDLGLTIVLAEHRLERILRYVERAVVLDRGRVAADGYAPGIVEHMPQLPPLAELGRRLSWKPLPITVKEGLRFARRVTRDGGNGSPGDHRHAGNVSVGHAVSQDRYHPDYHGTRQAATRAGARSVIQEKPVLEARDIRFAYNGKPVLRGIDMRVHPGEAVVLMGRNGSGKTTLLRCLIGLLRATSGDVSIAGQSIQGRRVADICRDVAYLPQVSDDLLYSETVHDELAATLRNHRLNSEDGAIQDMLDQLSLQEVASAYPRDLSVGQRQRVALGAVAVTRPRLLMLDEPTRGLDYGAKHDLVSLWRRLKVAGPGMLMVTHDVELAAQVADRVLIMSEGELIADGPAAEVLGASPLFAPQIARLFPGRGWLTVEDALAGIRQSSSGISDS